MIIVMIRMGILKHKHSEGWIYFRVKKIIIACKLCAVKHKLAYFPSR